MIVSEFSVDGRTGYVTAIKQLFTHKNDGIDRPDLLLFT